MVRDSSHGLLGCSLIVPLSAKAALGFCGIFGWGCISCERRVLTGVRDGGARSGSSLCVADSFAPSYSTPAMFLE